MKGPKFYAQPSSYPCSPHTYNDECLLFSPAKLYQKLIISHLGSENVHKELYKISVRSLIQNIYLNIILFVIDDGVCLFPLFLFLEGEKYILNQKNASFHSFSQIFYSTGASFTLTNAYNCTFQMP